MRAVAEGDREHDASAGQNGYRVSAREWGLRERGIEWIGVDDAVGGDGIGYGFGCERVGGDVVLVEDVVEAEMELSVVKVSAGAQGVVDEDVGESERVDGSLVMVSAVV